MTKIDQSRASHERLRAELRIRGTSLAQIARDLGVTKTTVSLVALGKQRSRRVERALADAMTTTPAELFPDRYAGEAKR